mgnify:CR=1 FL=1
MALTFPDVDRTQFLMVIGGNPAVSRMSFIQLPDPMKRLGAIVDARRAPGLREPAPDRVGEGRGRARLHPSGHRRATSSSAFLHEVLARDAV